MQGTPDVFNYWQEIRIDFKFENDQKIVEGLADKIKDDDFDDSLDLINEMEL